MQKVLIATRIGGQTHRILRNMAVQQDRTVSYLVRKAVEQYIGRRKEEPNTRSREE